MRARSIDDESIVELYDISKVIKVYDKKGLVKRDTALYLPKFRTLKLRKVRTLSVTNELLLVLYDDGRLEAISLSDGTVVSSLFYPVNQGLELFERINAFYFEPSSNIVYVTGTTSKYQQICFRAFSLESKTYSWSFGSEFPLAVLKVENFSKEGLLTEVYKKSENVKDLSLKQLSKDNLSLQGYATINFKDLSNEVTNYDASRLYSPDKSKFFVKDSLGYIVWNNVVSNESRRLKNVSTNYCIKWDSKSTGGVGFQNSEIHYYNGISGTIEDSLTWNKGILDVCFNEVSGTIFFLDTSYQIIEWSYANTNRKSPLHIPAILTPYSGILTPSD
jgi:hypothetical protein